MEKSLLALQQPNTLYFADKHISMFLLEFWQIIFGADL